MNESKNWKAAIRSNKGKFAVVVFYLLTVFILPLLSLTPYAQHKTRTAQNSFISEEADRVFREYIASLRKGDVAQAYSFLSEKSLQNVATSSMKKLTDYFSSTTDQVEVIGWHYNAYKAGADRATEKYNTYYQLPNTDPVNKYLVAQIVGENTGDGIKVFSTEVGFAAQSYEEQNRFNFAQQGIYLILSLLIAFFIIGTALRYLYKAPSPRWKIFLIILFLTLYINISPNHWSFNFGFSGFMNPGGTWGPWAFFTPLPLGAIYYWILRKRYETIPQEIISDAIAETGSARE